MVTAQTCGKINLQLLVGYPDANGYHQLESLFQAVDLKETVSLKKTAGGSSRINWKFEVPQGIAPNYCSERDQLAVSDLEIEKNLAYRAARLLADKAGYSGALELTITKQIPVAGGMAGGSADAGGALLAANQLFELGLSRKELAKIGARLGADVPTTVYGGTNFGCHYGDEITVLEDMPLRYWVIAVSPNLLSTPLVFKELARLRGSLKPPLPKLKMRGIDALNPPKKEALERELAVFYGADLGALADCIDNHLEPPAISLMPELEQTLVAATAAGAAVSFLSGSGPSIVALANNPIQQREIAQSLEKLAQVKYCLCLKSAPAHDTGLV